MGWGGAGKQIFDPVAQSLIENGASEDLLDKVCTRLAAALGEGDWDTEDESVQEFCGHPVVQHAIRKAQHWMELEDPQGRLNMQLEHDAGAARWHLLDRAGGVTASAVSHWEGFNALVRTWAKFANISDPEDFQDYLLG